MMARTLLIIFKDGMKDMIKDALKKRDFTEDALIVAQAAQSLERISFIMKDSNSPASLVVRRNHYHRVYSVSSP